MMKKMPDDVKLCLCMIVKNEGHIIERCIESALPWISAISICDTGSTDDTVSRIQAFSDRLPVHVGHEPFENFGASRSISFVQTRDFVKELDWDLSRSYALFLDADMELRVEAGYNFEGLTASGYNLVQKNGNLVYANTRLARLDVDWTCVGVTHEYWNNPSPPMDNIAADKVWIADRNDGGAKADKFERDARLLEQGLATEPKNERYMFYLAQTYNSLANKWNDIAKSHDDNAKKEQGIAANKHRNSAEIARRRSKDFRRRSVSMYERRISAGGWDEELWYSQLMIGRNYLEDDDFDRAVPALLQAYDMRPSRAEPLCSLSKAFRVRGKNHLAFQFARMAEGIPASGDLLFVESDAYFARHQLEKSICGFYLWPHIFPNGRLEGFLATEKLLRAGGASVPEEVRSNAKENVPWYVEPLKLKRKQFLPSMVERMHPTNPSVKLYGGRLLATVRHVNYVFNDQQRYSIPPEDLGCLVTRNVLCELDQNSLEPLWHREILDDFDYGERSIMGVEDLRLFRRDGKLSALAVTQRFNPYPQMCAFDLDPDDPKVIDPVGMMVIPGQWEKNWLPLDDCGLAIYKHHPFSMVAIGEEKPTPLALATQSKQDFSEFRGSASPVFVDSSTAFGMVHEVFETKQGRYYLHRFVEFRDKDGELQPVRYSFPFYLVHKGIEFVGGMEFLKERQVFVIGLGVRDHEAWICEVDRSTVDRQVMLPW
ncbi:MAG: tetratricopeptide repeat protein [Sulfobacillus sp.]